jgi:hypothetical protein
MLPGVRPSISLASLPTASTLPVSVLTATAEGSSTTIPLPLAKTRVLVVPKSMPRSFEKNLSNNRRLPMEIRELSSRSAIQIRSERTNNYARRTQRGPVHSKNSPRGKFARRLLLREKVPQFARLWVEPGVPEIKRRVRARKRRLEIGFSFGGDTPRVGAFIEGDGASCFPCFVGQIRCLRGHSKPTPIQLRRLSKYGRWQTGLLNHDA